MASLTQTLREVLEWHRALPQSEKDKINAESREVSRRAQFEAANTIAILDGRASRWYPPRKIIT